MPRLILTRGIPGSGKSTWAKEYQDTHANCVRVNRDSLRLMTYGKPYTDDARLEKLVRRIENKTVAECLDSGFDVVLDNTHCNTSSIIDWIKWADDTNPHRRNLVQIVVADFPIPLDIAMSRDSKRENPVGTEVILRMYGLLKKQRQEPDYGLTIGKLVVKFGEVE